jgi:hypothetical protein
MSEAIILKLMDGILGADRRANWLSCFSLIKTLYRSGRVNDDEALRGLQNLCADILFEKNPDMDERALLDQALDYAKKIFRSWRSELLKEKYLSMLRASE